MFSKRRQSKSEIFGIIRNIFSSGSKTSQKSNNVSSEIEPKNSKSLKKMMKCKMSFTRKGSKRNYSPEGRTKSSICNLSFEEVDLNLSHILKESSTFNKSNVKNKRFDNDTTQQTIIEDISFMSQICDTDIKKQTTNEVDTFNESDDDYYKKMKNTLLSRNKKAPFPKPKRTKSIRKEITDRIVPTTSTAVSNIPGCSFNVDQTEEIQIAINDISYISIDSEFLCSEIIVDTLEETDSVTELAKLAKHKNNGKILSLKKSKKYRFDPMARNESCGVVHLSDTIKTSSQMSWCSISSH